MAMAKENGVQSAELDISGSYATELVQFHNDYSLVRESFKTLFEEIRTSQGLEAASVTQLKVIVGIIRDMISCKNLLRLLNEAKDKEHVTYKHCINVGLTAGALAEWLQLSDQEIREAILGGLLHDVGKVMIPEKIINKAGKLIAYEFSIIRCHAYYSFQLVQFCSYIPEPVKYAVWQHHERLDGSGYPSQLKGQEISFLAQILAVADVYDAMTSDRAQRSELTLFDVIDDLSIEMFGKLNPDICLMLIHKMKDRLIGSSVLLNTGEEAKIIRFDPEIDHQPWIKLDNGNYVDLTNDKVRKIVQVI